MHNTIYGELARGLHEALLEFKALELANYLLALRRSNKVLRGDLDCVEPLMTGRVTVAEQCDTEAAKVGAAMSRTLDVCLNYDDEGDGPLSADQIAAGILRAVQPQRPSAEQLQVAGAAFDALFKRLETLPAGNIRRQGRSRRADHPHAGRPATTHSCPWD